VSSQVIKTQCFCIQFTEVHRKFTGSCCCCCWSRARPPAAHPGSAPRLYDGGWLGEWHAHGHPLLQPPPGIDRGRSPCPTTWWFASRTPAPLALGTVTPCTLIPPGGARTCWRGFRRVLSCGLYCCSLPRVLRAEAFRVVRRALVCVCVCVCVWCECESTALGPRRALPCAFVAVPRWLSCAGGAALDA